MRKYIDRIGRNLALLLFDAYIRDLIEHYVRRERDRWAEAFDVEKLRNQQIREHRDALIKLMIEMQDTKTPDPFYIEIKGGRPI